jgi:hypothetical protein
MATNHERQPFESLVVPETRWLVVFKRVVLAVVAVHLIVGAVSSYRAWFQVHSVEIITSEKAMHEGSNVRTNVVTYGRTPVDVTLDLIQDGHVVTLDQQRVPPNQFGFYDPRTQSLSFASELKPEHIIGFHNGPAILRATAIGRHQWMRLPPPFVRDIPIVVSTTRR